MCFFSKNKFKSFFKCIKQNNRIIYFSYNIIKFSKFAKKYYN